MKYLEHQALARQKSALLLVLFFITANFIALLNALVLALLLHLSPQYWWGVHLGTLILFWAVYRNYQSLWSDGASVAQSLNAEILSEPKTIEERRLLNVVEEVAIASGMAVPAVYLIPENESINAFAAGTDLRFMVLGITRGAMTQLNRDELQAVIAHEFSHILNSDVAMNMRLSAIISTFTILTAWGRHFIEEARERSVYKNKKDIGHSIGGVLWFFGQLGAKIGIFFQTLISRQREYLADAASVQFTRNPEGLARALGKIRYHAGGFVGSTEIDRLGHFLFVEGAGTHGLSSHTHPSIEDRIQRILPGVLLSDLAAKVKQDLKKNPTLSLNMEAFPLSDLDHELGSIQGAQNILTAMVLGMQKNISDEQILSRYETREYGLGRRLILLKKGMPHLPDNKMQIMFQALGRLQGLPLETKQDLLKDFEFLAQTDGKLSWLEILFLVNIEKQFRSEKIKKPQYRGLWALPDRVFRIVFWALHDGQGSRQIDPAGVKRAISLVRKYFPASLPMRLDGIVIPPASEALVYQDFLHLEGLPPLEKQKLLQILREIHLRDSVATQDEEVCLRLEAWLFGVPTFKGILSK